jgi:hypothetical protein
VPLPFTKKFTPFFPRLGHLTRSDDDVTKLKNLLLPICDEGARALESITPVRLHLLAMEAVALGRFYIKPEDTLPESGKWGEGRGGGGKEGVGEEEGGDKGRGGKWEGQERV